MVPDLQPATRLIAHYYRIYHRRAPVIGVDTSDTREAALDMLRADGVTFPVAAAPTLGTASAFGAAGLPATYFLDAQHDVVTKVLGAVSWQQLLDGTTLMHDPSPTPAATPSP